MDYIIGVLMSGRTNRSSNVDGAIHHPGVIIHKEYKVFQPILLYK
jgi:hypothetical protein